MYKKLLACAQVLVLASIPGFAQDEIFSDDFEWGSTCAWSNDLWYEDWDEDLFGDMADIGVVSACPAPAGFVSNKLDCDDSDPDISPAGVELCDGIDNDCSGEADDVCVCWASNCHQNADCEDTNNGPECVCQPGYEGDGFTCTNIDECGADPYPCDPNATCQDWPGEFGCTCNSGFEGDGITCTDIDECLANPCDPNATCENQPGDFSCECDEGYTGDGFICTAIP